MKLRMASHGVRRSIQSATTHSEARLHIPGVGSSHGRMQHLTPARSVRSVEWICAPVVLCLAVSVPAHAQTATDQVLEQGGLTQRGEGSGWNVTLGAGLAAVPRYLGAASDRVGVIPLISASYEGKLFLGPLGIGYAAINSGGFHAGPLLGLMGGRPQDADPHLEGLGDIATSMSAGGFGLYQLGHLVFMAAVEQAVTHTGNGLVGLAQINYRVALIPHRLNMTIGPQMEVANNLHEQTWFGVTPAQASQSGLPQFTPGGGVTDYGAHVDFSYRCSQHLILHALASVKELTSTVSDSPIVERRLQQLAGAGLAYQF
jgi:MipA family protein